MLDIGAAITTIALILTVYSVVQHSKELHAATEAKLTEIKLKLIHERLDLLKFLNELIVLPRNYFPNFRLRQTLSIPFQIDEHQPLLHGRDRCTDNKYYQTLLNEFQAKCVDVAVYFPAQLKEYDAFLDLSTKTLRTIKTHQDSDVIKQWDHELEKKTFDAFDLFIRSATKSIQCS